MSIYQQLLNFVSTNMTQLCQIYIQERKEEPPGILMIYAGEDTAEAKVCYIKCEFIPEGLSQDLSERISRNSSDIIYFFINAEEESSLLELDIRDYVS